MAARCFGKKQLAAAPSGKHWTRFVQYVAIITRPLHEIPKGRVIMQDICPESHERGGKLRIVR